MTSNDILSEPTSRGQEILDLHTEPNILEGEGRRTPCACSRCSLAWRDRVSDEAAMGGWVAICQAYLPMLISF